MKALKLLSPKEESERSVVGDSRRTVTVKSLHETEARIELMLLSIARLVITTTRNIMASLTDFLNKQKAFNDRQAAAIDTAVAGVAGLTDDVKALNDKITELQNSQGGVTPEDQALIDALEVQGEALTGRLETATAALAALDAQTPPVPPPTP